MRIGFLSALFLITYGIAIFYLGQYIMTERVVNQAQALLTRGIR